MSDFETHPAKSLSEERLVHFTPEHLRALLARHGFSVLEVETERVSREFGFEMTARLEAGTEAAPNNVARDPEEMAALYARGRAEMREERERRRRVASRVEELAAAREESVVYFWGANEYATDIAREIEGVVCRIVDSAASKIGGEHPGFDEPVQPPDFVQSSESHRIIVICPPDWNDQIREQIAQMELENVTVVDATTEP